MMNLIEIKSEIYGFVIGRLFGKNLCGFDCKISALGWVDYLFLIFVFFLVFFGARKIMNHVKDKKQ